MRTEKKYRELMKVNCTGCGYCMPCPANVMIPMCFEEYNKYSMFGNAENAMFYKLRLSGQFGTGKPGYASQCIACGACLKKCPQHIQIPEALKEVASILE